ncbi:MAG: nucleoside-diphosphate sugar epimerase/dehydratase [Campylobacterota bacterium]|nr:nucleoside-diphosphate sugar epimerase/dehydratase [Campylobacterota bacterium]
MINFQPSNTKRVFFFVILDIFISMSTIVLAYLLRFNFDIEPSHLPSMIKVIYILIPIKIALLALFRIYFVAWRYFGLFEYKRLVLAHIITYLFFTLIFLIAPEYFNPFPRSIIIIDMFLSLFFISLLRISKRVYFENNMQDRGKPTLIIGTNDASATIIKNALNSNSFGYFPIALISFKQELIGTYFVGIRVYGEKEIEEVILDNRIHSIIIAKELMQEELDTLYQRLQSLNIKDIKIANLVGDRPTQLKDISIEDLLARHPKDLDKAQIASFVANKTVLISGAGGSIGSEIARQCVLFEASKLILLDHSEFNLYTIGEEMKEANIELVMQSVVDREKLMHTFTKYRPEIVIHAAAYKHVPLCEANVEEAIVNNVIGTKNTIDCAIESGVDKFVLISTDKAVRPTNVMGTTKRICELYASNVVSNQTEIVAVRFGNVLGSSGSVIPKFRAQIEAGVPITVTHPDITRYFMLIPEACELVLQAASIGKGGELFILDMGEPVRIVDLAKKMIELSARNDIEIVYSGLRPGEKLYEELLIDESDTNTEYDSITIAKPTLYDINKLEEDIDELLSVEDKIAQLQAIVPEFTPDKKL